MLRAAELTLQIIDYLQTDREAPRSPRHWGFVPGPGQGRYSFGEAVARLAALPKPVVVGALNQPGYVAIWPVSALDAAERGHAEHALRNQQAYLRKKLAVLGLTEKELLLFEGCGTRIALPAEELLTWLGEYSLTWGWTVGTPTDGSHAARLQVLKDGRTWSPGSIGGARRAS